MQQKGDGVKRNKLINRRKEEKLKQREVAEAVGIDRGYYSNIETGKRNGSVDIWLRIGKFLKIPPDELLDYMREGMEEAA